MARDSDRLGDIEQRLAALPGEVMNLIGSRPSGEDWPLAPQGGGPPPADVGGPSPSQFEPVISRLEGVARMLEQRVTDQGIAGAQAGKIYEQQSLSGLIG